MLKERLISALIGAPLVLAIAYVGGWPLFALVLCLSMVGIHEFASLFGRRNVHPNSVILYSLTAAVLLSAMERGFETQMIILAVGIAASMVLEILKDSKNMAEPITIVFGIMYIPFLFSFLLRLSGLGTKYAILLVLCTWATDTFAYFAGMRFGRHSLAPVLSPRKSWEGAVGGFLGAVLVGLVACHILGLTSLTERLVLPTGVSISAQLGDLAESALKRYCEAKDSGNLIRGHGGVLDRFDSMIFASPVAYILVRLLSRKVGLP
ncbi:MAG TPA: phosphatidate cytidylyltransferase [Firmicutes bacterium]|nr:phosphatidate cytidylyltransferase [Bacillota bacterium]